MIHSTVIINQKLIALVIPADAVDIKYDCPLGHTKAKVYYNHNLRGKDNCVADTETAILPDVAYKIVGQLPKDENEKYLILEKL